MKEIIIINGSGGVGKDTFVNFCSKYVLTLNYSSVDEIKHVAQELGWQGGKEEKDRKFLSDLKLLSTDYNNFPFKCICNKIEAFKQGREDLLFIHIRDIPEIKAVIKKYPNVKTLLVKNSRVPSIHSNIADANVFNYNYDYVIDNCGTLEELQKDALCFVQSLV